MSEPELAIYIPVKEIFPEVKADLETLLSLLKNLSRTDALVWCGRLNLILSDVTISTMKRQKLCIERFLSAEERDLAFEFAKKVESSSTSVIAFSRGQLLELIRWVAFYSRDFPEDGKTFEDPEVRRKFLQAALICSKICIDSTWGTEHINDTVDRLVEGNAPDISRKSTEASAATDLVICLGRGWTIFRDYLPKHRPSFEEEFFDSTKLSIEQYFICLSIVLSYSLRPTHVPGFNYKSIPKQNAFKDIFLRYMKLQSQTPEELCTSLGCMFPRNSNMLEEVLPYSKKALRERPILHTHHGIATILDPLFFGASSTAGPLFHIIRNHPTKARDLFAAFGKAFEDYVNDILKRIFGQSTVLANPLDLNKKVYEFGGAELEIDACINGVERVALIESKALWITEETLLTGDPQDYIDKLQQKYIEPKGLAQLARVIIALADSRQLGVNINFTGATLVFPVIIVYDQFIPTMFLGRYLIEEFERLLNPDSMLQNKRMQKGHLTITPPIILAIETLEGLESLVKNYGFLDLLEDYSLNCEDGKTTLWNYIANSRKYNQFFNPRNSIANKASEALDTTARKIFPEAYSDES